MSNYNLKFTSKDLAGGGTTPNFQKPPIVVNLQTEDSNVQ